MLPQDLNYIESQGCLRVPMRDTLDEMVQQYFRYIHPMFPLIDEVDFWDMYDQKSSKPSATQMPLLLLQAMLFASSTVSSSDA